VVQWADWTCFCWRWPLWRWQLHNGAQKFDAIFYVAINALFTLGSGRNFIKNSGFAQLY
jgi:hypothetical protein